MNAQHHFEQGDYTKALHLLKNASNPAELELKAYCFQKTAAFELAMLEWNILIKSFPEHASYYNERAVCKFNLRFKHAMEDFNKAISLEPDNPYYYACRAYVKDKTGDSEGAVEDYQKAHDLDPSDAVTLNNLGLAEQKLGYTAKAREFFKKSNDLVGITTRDAEVMDNSAPITKPSFKAKVKEVGKMLSSLSEFKRFLKELFN